VAFVILSRARFARMASALSFEIQERRMKKTALILAALTLATLMLAAIAAQAKDEMSGTIVSENSVQCGTENKNKKKSTDMMCQEYVIRTGSTDYHVRQEKEAHKELIPVNAPVELSIKKDKMKFKVNSKEYEMLIVSESAAPAPGATSAATPATPVK
jgi:uncharacterized low-complexity protein